MTLQAAVRGCFAWKDDLIRSGRLGIELRIDEVAATGSSRVLAGFIRSVFRRIGRKSENLDLVLVVRQPFLNRF
jgi:hypothetical protein